jgi:ketosteroid isomerase-like protein
MAAIFDRYLQAWLDDDWDAAVALWSEDVVHHVPGSHRLAGTFRGKQAFLDHYHQVFEEVGGTIEVVGVHDVLQSEDHAVALVTERAVRGERSLEFNRVVVYHTDGEHITETWSFDFDPYSIDEFWA